MEALVLTGDKHLEFRKDYPVPDAPDDRPTALVRIAACGICGSDLPRAYQGKAYFYPLVMGHEFSGTVEEPARDGKYPAGTRVAVFPLLPRNLDSDPACLSGNYAQAREYDYFGSRRDGGFCQYLRVPEWNLFPVPEQVNLLHAAMTEPAAVALHGVRKFSSLKGGTAAVFGAGPIGNLAAQWLRIHGCAEVFVVDLDPAKLALVQTQGFIPIDARGSDPVAAILDATSGRGVTASVEACGLPATFLQAIQVAGTGGEVLFMGNIAGEFRIGEKDFSNILRKELRLHGTWNSKIRPAESNDWTTVLNAMDRELQIGALITARLPLQRGPEIFRDLAERRGHHNKVMFDISPDDT